MQSEIKNYSDSELLQMARDEVKKMDIHLWAQMVISIILVSQAIFMLSGIISFITYFFMLTILLVIYLFHKNRAKKSEFKIQEIIDELTNREI